MNSYNSSLHEREHQRGHLDYDEPVEQDREISLGAATILGIFFGLALICSLFFGLGYSMGRRSAAPIVTAATEAPTTPTSNAAKPPSGSADEMAPELVAEAAPTPVPVRVPKPTAVASATPPPVSAEKTEPKPAIVPSATAGTIYVQIAAVSHREDADVLLSNLKQRGYAVFIRQEMQDKLLHVQVGPYATRKDADTMRQRLLSDGYNAIVK